MELDRPHFPIASTSGTTIASANTSASELFICFASRLTSSSSMKFSKSILSPGRARDGSVSLSASLSRRLRSNGSLKGGQASPFLANTGKKRGCAFENPEPSSPKVTCIGQVRVKTKKKVKQTRSLSRKGNGEVGLRKAESGDGLHQNEDRISLQPQQSHSIYQHQHSQEYLPHRNQRWVHLPVTICESLRSFGAEFSCLFPCKSSCFSTCEREKTERQNGSGDGQTSCGAVFTRWLVSVNDGEGGKRRDIELVVGGGDEEETMEVRERMSMRSSRRHVFEDIEIKDDRIEVKGQVIGGEEEEARVSICLPPKNALLLMRCRSDPVKMATLANRFSWDGNAVPENEEPDDADEYEDVEEQEDAYVQECQVTEQNRRFSVDSDEEEEEENSSGEETNLAMETEMADRKEGNQELEVQIISTEEVEKETDQEAEDEDETEGDVESNMSSFEALLEQETADYCPVEEKEQIEENPISPSSPPTDSDEQETAGNQEPEEELTVETEAQETTVSEPSKEDEAKAHPEDEQITVPAVPIESEMKQPENQETSIVESDKGNESPVLPECLLLMMCEPKLSMEVSKETWVCTTDFVRWLPERPLRKPTTGACNHEPVKQRLSTDSKPKYLAAPATAKSNENNLQPRRSSCSLPSAAAASMTTIIEQKTVNPVAFEPLVLPRCKSEPMRSAAAKLKPESCFWKNAVGKLEPHRRATVGVGAAGAEF